MDKQVDTQTDSRSKHYIAALTIAGSDCSGGAGIQADIKTFSALGVYAASAITAITVQNTLGVSGVEGVAATVVEEQIHAVMTDIRPAAVKVGMVHDVATIEAIARALACYPVPHIVVDPIMVSTSGCPLLADDAMQVFRQRLLPLATLLTPNIPEAEVLSGMTITDAASCHAAGMRIAAETAGYVLIKGGHAVGDSKTDRLYGADGLKGEFTAATVATPNTHGTGCTLSAAITAYLALGHPIEEAVAQAKTYMTQALVAGSDVAIGLGRGPVNHFFSPLPLFKL